MDVQDAFSFFVLHAHLVAGGFAQRQLHLRGQRGRQNFFLLPRPFRKAAAQRLRVADAHTRLGNARRGFELQRRVLDGENGLCVAGP